MRNYGDKDAAATEGATKRSLLTGEEVNIGPATLRGEERKASTPTPAPAPRPARRAPRKSARRAGEGEVSLKTTAPPAVKSVELFEGSKRRSVEFP
jgi:hypothetical protein